RWQVANMRLSAGASQLIMIPLLSAVFTPILTMVARGPLSVYGLSQTLNKKGGFGQGIFHAIVGGVSWGFMIPFFVILYWLLFEGTPASQVRRRFWPASLAGALGGVVGGVINTFCVYGVFSESAMVEAGWIAEAPKTLYSLFRETRFGFFFPVTGFFLG